MLFLLDNGAHSIKFGHDHEPTYFFLFSKNKSDDNKHASPACSRTLSSAQRATSSLTMATRSRSAGTDHPSTTGYPLKRSSAHKDIIPVSPIHPHKGLCRRLGRTKGHLGWDVSSIPKGSPFSWPPVVSQTRVALGGHPGILHSDNRALLQPSPNPADLRPVRL